MKKTVFTLTTLILLGGNALIANPVFAQASHAGHGTDHNMNHSKSDQKSEIYTTRGRIEGIDKTAQKLKIWHEPIPALKWPAMTMNFSLDDVALMKGLNVKDKVRFDIRIEGANSIITDIEVIK